MTTDPVPTVGLPSLSFPSWMQTHDIVWEVLTYPIVAGGLTIDDLDAAIANRSRSSIRHAVLAMAQAGTIQAVGDPHSNAITPVEQDNRERWIPHPRDRSA